MLFFKFEIYVTCMFDLLDFNSECVYITILVLSLVFLFRYSVGMGNEKHGHSHPCTRDLNSI